MFVNRWIKTLPLESQSSGQEKRRESSCPRQSEKKHMLTQ